MDINHILQAAIDGDSSAEQELFAHLSVRFELFLRHRFRNEEERKDIAQEACLTVLKKYKTEVFSKGFEVWAHGVLKIIILRHFEKMKQNRDRDLPLNESMQASTMDKNYKETEQNLLLCLKKIKDHNLRYARVLNYIYQGYSTEELCRRMSCSRNNLYVIINRGRSLLLECMKKGEI